MMVQTRCKLNNAELFLKLCYSILGVKKLEAKSTTKKQQNLKNGKSEISPEY